MKNKYKGKIKNCVFSVSSLIDQIIKSFVKECIYLQKKIFHVLQIAKHI